MRSYFNLPALAGSLLLAGGCAGYKVVRVAAGDQVTKGIRYWRPAPYLLVSEGVNTPDEAKALATAGVTHPLTYQLIYLPDPQENYAIKHHGGLGTADLAFKLVDGWKLTEVNTKTDSKIPETITAVGGLLTAVAGLKDGKKPESAASLNEPPKLTPGLYKILLTDAGATLKKSSLVIE